MKRKTQLRAGYTRALANLLDAEPSTIELIVPRAG